MKKILSIVCALMLGMGFAQAQVHQGETAVGANLVYGSEIESLGIGARFQYGILDQLRSEVSINRFFEHNHLSWWDVNINAHYLVGLVNDQFFIYPLAGLNYTMVDYKGELNDKGEENHIGLNVGAGIEYELNEHFGVNLEYRHTIIRKVDQGVIGLGVNYKF
jgi:outer membrane protein X